MQLPQNPIFIVGYPRSGTTLLQRLLVTQPGLYTFPETHYFCVIEKKIPWGEDKETIPPAALPIAFENIYEKMGICFTAAEVETLNRQAENKQLSSKALFETIVTRYLLNLYPGIETLPSWRWIEKTPNHAHYLERILDMYPRAQVLHILRHPVPAIFSRKLKFPFNREIPVTELARRWNRMLDDVDRFKSQNPNYILTLRYEDLVTQMEEEMKRLGTFLEIAFDIQRYSGINRENPGLPEGIILPSEPWKLEDLRRELTNTNDDYKTVFSRQDAEAVEAVIGDRLEKCGYESFY